MTRSNKVPFLKIKTVNYFNNFALKSAFSGDLGVSQIIKKFDTKLVNLTLTLTDAARLF